ncbi:sugar kinase [Ancylobacter pratisalsi]|uniref:Sugar kinase n=1 Tax=Ancylobacter pratisalsi TaxID=1745854 RepID=A0A6P1YLN4_9HYPH|nr:sugar kinase [Ancylobacter pratisalsi]QIB33596.1 sugar kinase [Ancylobacter pratisalsi]
MSGRLFLSIGEAMVELSQHEGALWRMGFAGDTLNTAWYMRACLDQDTVAGGWRVAYFSRLGADPFSERMIRFLDANRIETGYIGRDPQRNVGLYSIELHEGERSFSYWRGQSAARLLADDEAALASAIAQADAVYFSGVTLAILAPDRRAFLLECVAQTRAAGKMTAFDPNLRPQLWESADAMREWLRRAAGVATIALPSFDDEATWFGDADILACARRWREDGAGEVVVKNGGGTLALLAGSGEIETQECTRVVPVDSTGAGDSFNGGYLAARLRGLAPSRAARCAHDLAMRVVGARGALLPMADLSAEPALR